MIRKAANNLLCSTKVVPELCHSEQAHKTRFCPTTTTQRLISSFVNPSPESRAVKPAIVDNSGTGSAVEADPATADTCRPMQTVNKSANGSGKRGVRAASASSSAASHDAGDRGSTARIIGVSEAVAAGGRGGGGGSSKRCYWALDGGWESRSGRFVAEPCPPVTMEVGQDTSQANRRAWCIAVAVIGIRCCC